MIVDQRPAVTAVADEGVGLPRAGHPEVGPGSAHKGGHAGERSLGVLEYRCTVAPPPQCTGALWKHSRGSKGVTDSPDWFLNDSCWTVLISFLLPLELQKLFYAL